MVTQYVVFSHCEVELQDEVLLLKQNGWTIVERVGESFLSWIGLWPLQFFRPFYLYFC